MIKIKRSRWPKFVKWGAAIGILGVTLYPIVIYPMIDATYYRDVQKITRKDIDQKTIQPGNMKVWSDPFNRKQ